MNQQRIFPTSFIIKNGKINYKQGKTLIACDSNQKYLIAAQETKIFIFEQFLQSGTLKILRKFTQHQGLVTDLQLMNKYWFVSSSQDSTIKIWTRNQRQGCTFFKDIQGQYGGFNCFVITEDENEIISGSDMVINFWSEKFDWLSEQQIYNERSGNIISLALSPSSKQLISLGSGGFAMLFEKPKDKSWLVMKGFEVSPSSIFYYVGDKLLMINQDNKLSISLLNGREKKFFKQKKKLTQKSNIWSFISQYFQSNKLVLAESRGLINFQKISENLSLYLQSFTNSLGGKIFFTGVKDMCFIFVCDNINSRMMMIESRSDFQ